MGGYLPNSKEISCYSADSEEIKVYNFDSKKGLVQLTKEESSCYNPARLGGGACMPGGRFFQFKNKAPSGDTVYYKGICRPRSPGSTKEDAVIGDMGVISYNANTGASCWWDDVGGHDGRSVPGLDLTSASAEEVKRFDIFWGQTEGVGCVGCHDSDPFIYSPYVSSIKWQTSLDFTKGAFHLVKLDGSKGQVGKYLVEPKAKNCTICHRIGNGSSCEYSQDSWGDAKVGGLQHGIQEFNNAANWKVMKTDSLVRTAPYWMPDHNFSRTDIPTPENLAQWNQGFGEARKAVEDCCANKSNPGCWQNIPATGSFYGIDNLQSAMERGIINASALLTPESVSKSIKDNKKPTIWSIGDVEPLIKGAVSIGDLREEVGQNYVKELEKIHGPKLKDQEIILYCGCCPSKDCPYLLTALPYLHERGYSNLKIIDFQKGVRHDWIDKGLPVEGGR